MSKIFTQKKNIIIGVVLLTCLVLVQIVINIALFYRIFEYHSNYPCDSLKKIYNDFFVFWNSAKIINENKINILYNPSQFHKFLENSFNCHIENKNLGYFWIYSPITLLITYIFGFFSFSIGFFIWQFIFLFVSMFLLFKAKLPKYVILFSVLSPASLINMHYAQLGLITGSLFVSGLVFSSKKKIKSGILFSFITIKPQAGLIIPIIMMANRQWKIIITGIFAFLTLVATITLIMGPRIWSNYINHGLPMAHAILVAPFPNGYEISGISVFWMARSLGSSVPVAWLFQGVAALGAIVCGWAAWRSPEGDLIARITLTTALTPLLSPYGFTHDLCALSIMTAWSVWRNASVTAIDIIVWLWPIYCSFISTNFHAELSPLVLVAASMQAWKNLHAGSNRTTLRTQPVRI